MFNPNEFALPGFVPKGTYSVFVHSVENKQSKKGNLMDTFKLEIISPLTAVNVLPDGSFQTCEVGKTEINTFLTYQNDKWLAGRVEGLKRLGIIVKKQYDSFEDYVKHLQSQTPSLVGKVFDISVDSETEFAKRPLTAEDMARGIKEAEDLRGPDGKPIVLRYKPRCDFAGVVGNLRSKDSIPNWGGPESLAGIGISTTPLGVPINVSSGVPAALVV